MADITNAQAVRFANEKARTLADLIQAMDRTLAQFALAVVQDFEGPATAHQNADVIADGSTEDGRNPVTKFNVGELKYVCEQLNACMATDDRRAIVARWAVNGRPIY